MSTVCNMVPSFVVLFLVGLGAAVQSLELTDEFLDRLVGLEIQNAAYDIRIKQLEKTRCGSTRGARGMYMYVGDHLVNKVNNEWCFTQLYKHILSLIFKTAGMVGKKDTDPKERGNHVTNAYDEQDASAHDGKELQNGGPVAFTAYLATDLDNVTPKTPIVFDTVLLNDGHGYNSTTGIFTAPVQGAYYFSFFIGEKDDEQFNTMLTVNHENYVGAAAEGIADGHDDQGGNAATVQLNIGDQVQVVHRHVGNHVEGSTGLRLSTFSGFLLYATDYPAVEPSIIG